MSGESTELYQKLVRDRIPQLIHAAGDVPTWSRLTDDDAYVAALCDKVIEEVGELRAASQPQGSTLYARLKMPQVYPLTPLCQAGVRHPG